jgi:hypothetical protein
MQGHAQGEVTRYTEEQIRERVASKLSGQGANRILGSQLGELVNQALAPTGTFQDYRIPGSSSKLRPFAERVLQGVVEATAERKGTDSYYAILGTSAPAPAPTPAPSPSVAPYAGKLWRTFVAVSSRQQIVFDSSIGALSVISQGEIPEGTTVVPSATFGEHRAMLAAFIAELKSKDGHIPALEMIEATYSAQAYPQWLKVLRSEQPPLDKEWGKFRQEHLVELFKGRLSLLGLSSERVGQLGTEFARDYQQAVASRIDRSNARTSEIATTDIVSHKEKRAREALHRMIDRMSFEQIQQLQLPFAAMLTLLGTD